jgi:hypothetical protein
MNDIFGPILVNQIMMNIHLKMYKFADTVKEKRERKRYKEDFTAYFRENYEAEMKDVKKLIVHKERKRAKKLGIAPNEMNDEAL